MSIVGFGDVLTFVLSWRHSVGTHLSFHGIDDVKRRASRRIESHPVTAWLVYVAVYVQQAHAAAIVGFSPFVSS